MKTLGIQSQTAPNSVIRVGSRKQVENSTYLPFIMLLFLVLGLGKTLGDIILGVEVSEVGTTTPPVILPWTTESTPSEITPEGIYQHQQLGSQLKAKYLHLLKAQSQVEVRTVDTESALESAKAQLKVILGEEGEVNQESNDILDFKWCERIFWLMERDRFQNKEYLSFMEKAERHLEEFQKLSANNSSDIHSINQIGEAVLSYQHRNKELSMAQEVKELAVEGSYRFKDKLVLGSRDQGKLALHGFFTHLLETLHNSTLDPYKFKIFITEETFFLGLLKMLGLYEPPLGPSSSLVIELHNETEYFLRFFYNGELAQIANCDTNCKLSDFQRYVKKKTFESDEKWKRLCGKVGDPPPTFWKQYVLPALVCIALFLLFRYNMSFATTIAKKFKRD